MSFDTNETVKKLKAAGFSEAQAEALRYIDLSEIATRPERAEPAIKTDIAIVNNRRDYCAGKSDVAALKVEMLKWILVGAMGLQTIAIIAVFASLSRGSH